MIVSKSIFDQIGDIIERQYNDFSYRILGREFLTPEQQLKVEALGLLVGQKPLLELVYLLVKQRTEVRYQTDQTLQELLDEIFATGIIGTLPPEAQSTIDNTAVALHNIIEASKQEVKNQVTKELIKINREEQASVRSGVLPMDTEDSRGLLVNGALLAVGAAFLLKQKKFLGDFTTELTNFVNHATVDAIRESSSMDSPSGETLVYKRVMKDASLCNWCGKAYVNPDGTPRLFKLSELIANGSNFGKPKSQWLPVVDAHHPRCRCQLLKKETT